MRIRSSYILTFLAGVVVLAAAQWVIHSIRRAQPEPPQAGAVDANQKPEPWGDLEITPLVLDRPDDYFLTNRWDRIIRWSFPNSSAEQIRELIQSCELRGDQKNSLLDTNHWEALAKGWRIIPTRDVVADMSASAREKIYSQLGEHLENPNQRWPYFYRVDGLDEWLEHSELSEEALAFVRKLCYTKFQRIYFADSEIFELLRSPEEARLLTRTLARVPTMLMRVRVNPESNVETLLHYWGRFRKGDELDCLLRSMARVPDGTAINVTHFMPPVPRSHIYTYPGPEVQGNDCFWTAFNFCNDLPRDYLTNSLDYNQVLRSGYKLLSGPRMFGDLMLLLESGDTAAHMCVYIAADVVYTKNGLDSKQPWVLMRIKDMMALYASDKPQQWRAFRKNGV